MIDTAMADVHDDVRQEPVWDQRAQDTVLGQAAEAFGGVRGEGQQFDVVDPSRNRFWTT